MSNQLHDPKKGEVQKKEKVIPDFPAEKTTSWRKWKRNDLFKNFEKELISYINYSRKEISLIGEEEKKKIKNEQKERVEGAPDGGVKCHHRRLARGVFRQEASSSVQLRRKRETWVRESGLPGTRDRGDDLRRTRFRSNSVDVRFQEMHGLQGSDTGRPRPHIN